MLKHADIIKLKHNSRNAFYTVNLWSLMKSPSWSPCETVTYKANNIWKETSGQSYKGSTIVNYDSRVIIWGNFKSGTTLES